MKKLFNNSLVLAAILTASTYLQAETVELSEVDGECPSVEISYLNNLTAHAYMEGVGTINAGWDADKYSFTPAADGTLKVHFSTPSESSSIKIDSACNGSGIFRSTGEADHGEKEFSVEAGQTIHIALWDWGSGDGYDFNLDVEFTPDDGGSGEDPSKVSITQDTSSVGEGSAHAYRLILDNPSSSDTTVTVAIGHLTTDDDDVEEVTRDIVILAGETSAVFTVDTLDDSLEESGETFTVTITQTDDEAIAVDETASAVETNIIDDDATGTGDDVVIYEDAQNSNTAGWANISSQPGSISNITDVGDNRVIKLTGSTTGESRAAYTFKNDNGTLWNDTQNFIAKWDMKTSDDYELFFIAKSSDDSSIDNYIGYVSILPELEGYSFDSSTGYWSSGGTVLYSWGRYIYIVLDDDISSQLTTITKDLYADASEELGISLTSIESMHVNVYGAGEAELLLDNITLHKEDTVPNSAPIADNQDISMDENDFQAITLTASDDNGDTLTYSIVGQPSNGALDLSGATATYTPNTDYNGTDSFTFKANDGTDDSNVATISITINDVAANIAPVAQNQDVSLNENETIAITLAATDGNSDTLTYSIVDQPLNGTLYLTGTTATYTPNTDYNGTDSFTFKANDGTDDSNVATISITINDIAANIAPVAQNQDVSLNENETIAITLNATDGNSDTLTYSIVDQPLNGTLYLTGTTATYTPNTDYNGTDSFTFKANDGTDDSNVATVGITVNDVAGNIIEVTENEALSEHFLGMPIDVDTNKTTKITGIITADWDMDRYSFDSNGLGEVKITLKDSSGQDMPFYVIKNYNEILSSDSTGFYNFGDDFSLITVMLIAKNSGGSDSDNTYTLTIEGSDTTSPVITLTGDADINIIIGDTYTDAGATANDNKDGDITSNIIADSNVDSTTVGTYTITYNVSDAAGNAASELTRTVNVIAAELLEVEAENATLTEPMVIEDGEYIVTTVNNSGSAEFTFNVTQAGNYKLEGKYIAPNGTSDSFFIQMNDGVVDIWDLPNTADWAVTNVSGRYLDDDYTYLLEAGTHIFTLGGREAGSKLDKLTLVKVAD